MDIYERNLLDPIFTPPSSSLSRLSENLSPRCPRPLYSFRIFNVDELNGPLSFTYPLCHLISHPTCEIKDTDFFVLLIFLLRDDFSLKEVERFSSTTVTMRGIIKTARIELAKNDHTR